MSIVQFTQKDNITMLWEVISDEECFRFLARDIQTDVHQLFLNNIQGFFDNEKIKVNSLVDINKKYILLILNHVKRHYNIEPSKITIHKEQVNEPITYKEIQNDRRNNFDRDLNIKREEFEDLMTIKAPSVPEFADKEGDKPIKEMDKILKEMQTQRNYEIEQINSNNNCSTTQVDNWLKPQETSLKTDKFNFVEPTKNNRFKFLDNIANQVPEVIKDAKNVSFNNIDYIQTYTNEDEDEDNIFSKLKKVSSKKIENNKLDIDEDRISKLEIEVKNMSIKMDNILELLSKTQ